jgi:hypothetical protein
LTRCAAVESAPRRALEQARILAAAFAGGGALDFSRRTTFSSAFALGLDPPVVGAHRLARFVAISAALPVLAH